MSRRSLLLLSLAMLLPACGSGPGESRHRKRYFSVKKLYNTAKEKKEHGEFRGAVKALDDFDKAADKLMTKVPPGDIYRDKAKALIGQAKDLRKEVNDGKRKAEKPAVEIAKGKKPEPAEQFWGEAVEKAVAEERIDPEVVERRRAEAARKETERTGLASAKADMAARRREVLARQKIEEVDPEAEAKKAKARAEKKALVDPMAKPKMPTDKITEETKPLRVVKICRKGNSVVAYVLLVNKGKDPFRVGSVTGDLLDIDSNFVERVTMSFEAGDFEPNWKNIFDSKGTGITAESLEVKSSSAKMIAVVAAHPQASRIRKVRLKIPTSTGDFFQGPD